MWMVSFSGHAASYGFLFVFFVVVFDEWLLINEARRNTTSRTNTKTKSVQTLGAEDKRTRG